MNARILTSERGQFTNDQGTEIEFHRFWVFDYETSEVGFLKPDREADVNHLHEQFREFAGTVAEVKLSVNKMSKGELGVRLIDVDPQ
jgi:hypothetical protein